MEVVSPAVAVAVAVAAFIFLIPSNRAIVIHESSDNSAVAAADTNRIKSVTAPAVSIA